MVGAARTVKRLLRRVGIVNGQPRIHNVTKDIYFLGYTKVNTMATTPFARTKTHKAWFVGDADVECGDLIIDRVENLPYLVMSMVPEYSGHTVAYYDGTLYTADVIATISRYDSVTKDAFGMAVNPGFVTVASGLNVMVNPVTIDDFSQEDRVHSHNKVNIYMQSVYSVKVNDRISTDRGDDFKVINVNSSALTGITIVAVEPDSR